jgi:hypothetical protein
VSFFTLRVKCSCECVTVQVSTVMLAVILLAASSSSMWDWLAAAPSSLREVDPPVCVPAYGQSTSSCGFQCYGPGNPCNDCVRTNACGSSCCPTDGQMAVDWMNSVNCDYANEYRYGTSACNAFKDGHVDEKCT